MGLWKRGDWYWLDALVHGHRFREPLGTTDWREAKRLERERVEQIRTSISASAANLTYAAMDVATAIAAYAQERRAQVFARMAAYWLENSRSLKRLLQGHKAPADDTGAAGCVSEHSNGSWTRSKDH